MNSVLCDVKFTPENSFAGLTYRFDEKPIPVCWNPRPGSKFYWSSGTRYTYKTLDGVSHADSLDGFWEIVKVLAFD